MENINMQPQVFDLPPEDPFSALDSEIARLNAFFEALRALA
jgi:hypothetical protein